MDINEKAPIACGNEDANSGKTMVAVTPEKMVKHMAFLKSLHSPSQQTTTKFARVLADTKGFGQAGPSNHYLFMSMVTHKAHCVPTMLQVFVNKFNVNQEVPAGYKIPKKQVIVLDLFDDS